MPAYSFEAIDAQGQTHRGVLEADTAKAARGVLRGRALVPLASQNPPRVLGCWLGGAAVFVLGALLSAGAVALLVRIVEPARPAPPDRHPLREMQDGAQFVWRHEHLRPMAVAGVVWNISWFVLQAAYVPYAVRALGLGSEAVGITLGCYGAGMVLGSLLAPRLVARLPFGRAIQFGPVVSVFAMTTMVLTLLVPHGALAGLSFFLFGAGPIIWTITTTTLRQAVTPHGMLGRVGAVFLTVNAGARPVGAAVGGILAGRLAERFGARRVVLFGGVMLAAGLVVSTLGATRPGSAYSWVTSRPATFLRSSSFLQGPFFSRCAISAAASLRNRPAMRSCHSHRRASTAG